MSVAGTSLKINLLITRDVSPVFTVVSRVMKDSYHSGALAIAIASLALSE